MLAHPKNRAERRHLKRLDHSDLSPRHGREDILIEELDDALKDTLSEYHQEKELREAD
jgi:hypothetical protein